MAYSCRAGWSGGAWPLQLPLKRDDRYALHGSVEHASGGGGEFFVAGRARLVEDPALRQVATTAAPFTPAERYILFELKLVYASSTIYAGGNPLRKHWRADQA